MPIALIPTLAELELVTGGRSSLAAGEPSGRAVTDRTSESALIQGRIELARVAARRRR